MVDGVVGVRNVDLVADMEVGDEVGVRPRRFETERAVGRELLPWIVAAPLPTLIAEKPLPATSVELPDPARMKSKPEPPASVSSPLPPMMTLLPLPPVIESPLAAWA